MHPSCIDSRSLKPALHDVLKVNMNIFKVILGSIALAATIHSRLASAHEEPGRIASDDSPRGSAALRGPAKKVSLIPNPSGVCARYVPSRLSTFFYS